MPGDREHRIRILERDHHNLFKLLRKADDAVGWIQQDTYLTRTIQGRTTEPPPPPPPFANCTPCNIPAADLSLSYTYDPTVTQCAGTAGMSGPGTIDAALRYQASTPPGGDPTTNYWMTDCLNVAISCYPDPPFSGLFSPLPYSRFVMYCSATLGFTWIGMRGYKTAGDCTGDPLNAGFALFGSGPIATTGPNFRCNPLRIVANAEGVTNGTLITYP